MGSCKHEIWSVLKIVNALENKETGGVKIVIPRFQRGRRWDQKQMLDCMDSMQKGYPIGALLFYRKSEKDSEYYILADGLQRSTTLKDYMHNPVDYFNASILDESYYISLCNSLGWPSDSLNFIKDCITVSLEQCHVIENIVSSCFYSSLKNIAINNKLKCNENVIKNLGNMIATDLRKVLFDKYEKVKTLELPIIIYTGDEIDLVDIFSRINATGTPLTQYDIYAATWPTIDKYKRSLYVKHSDITNAVMNKYRIMAETAKVDGANNYDLNVLNTVTAFEYVFGLGKVLIRKYSILDLVNNVDIDVPDAIIFELLNACLNDNPADVRNLYENLASIENWSELADAVDSAVNFVSTRISPLLEFKANTHKEDSTDSHNLSFLPSKYQVISLIASVFKAMFDIENLSMFRQEWIEAERVLDSTIKQYFVYDIIDGSIWSNGGQGKMFRYIKSKRYLDNISNTDWAVLLKRFYEDSMRREEMTDVKNIASVCNSEYIFLNCIYLHEFTVDDQYNKNKVFDVEHIAPRKMMIDYLDRVHAIKGLPISSIANLCYLPSYINRSKRERTIYQDKLCLKDISINDVQDKYFFIDYENMRWSDQHYLVGDEEALSFNYRNFCNARWNILKHKFCAAMNINDIIPEVSVTEYIDKKIDLNIKTNVEKPYTVTDIKEIIKRDVNKPLVSKGSQKYATVDNSIGFNISLAKYDKNKKGYWYSFDYSVIETAFKEIELVYLYYVRKDAVPGQSLNRIVKFPLEFIMSHLNDFKIENAKNPNDIRRRIVIYDIFDGRCVLQTKEGELDITEFLIQ